MSSGHYSKKEHDDLANLVSQFREDEPWKVIRDKHNALGYNRTHDSCRNHWKRHLEKLEAAENARDEDDDPEEESEEEEEEPSNELGSKTAGGPRVMTRSSAPVRGRRPNQGSQLPATVPHQTNKRDGLKSVASPESPHRKKQKAGGRTQDRSGIMNKTSSHEYETAKLEEEKAKVVKTLRKALEMLEK